MRAGIERDVVEARFFKPTEGKNVVEEERALYEMVFRGGGGRWLIGGGRGGGNEE